jgi:5-methylcytosine-specific restriction enzyme subunit McrC
VYRCVVERLHPLAASSITRQLLGELRETLGDVAFLPSLTHADAPPTLISRLNQRYKPLLDLARLFLANLAPAFSYGPLHTFNFLFNMNDLFESFIANFIRKHRAPILDGSPLADCSLCIQSAGHRRHLATDDDHAPHFQLKPDLAFHRPPDQFPLILDTKYKLLDPKHRRYDVHPADFYQMFAYAHRYRANRVLLLYPHLAATASLQPKTFHLDATNFHVTAATIDLTADLTTHAARQSLITNLRKTLLAATPV